MNRFTHLSPDERWREILVTVLSLAAVRRRRLKVAFLALPSLFEMLQEEFPESIPEFDIAELTDRRYSYVLTMAWQQALGAGHLEESPSGRYLAVQPTRAEHNVKLMERRYGELWIKRYAPVADRLDEIILDKYTPH